MTNQYSRQTKNSQLIRSANQSIHIAKPLTDFSMRRTIKQEKIKKYIPIMKVSSFNKKLRNFPKFYFE